MPGSQNRGSQNRSDSQDSKSEAARKMRSGNPEERSEGASELGQSGGRQSHKND